MVAWGPWTPSYCDLERVACARWRWRCARSGWRCRSDSQAACGLCARWRWGCGCDLWSGRGAMSRAACPVLSRHVISGHVSHVMLRRYAVSCPMSRHVMSCHVMSCHVLSRHVASCHVMSRRVRSCRFLSCRVAPCHAATSGHNTLRQLPHSHTAQSHAAHTHTAHIHTTRVDLSTSHSLRFRLPTHVSYLSFRCGVIRSYYFSFDFFMFFFVFLVFFMFLFVILLLFLLGATPGKGRQKMMMMGRGSRRKKCALPKKGTPNCQEPKLPALLDPQCHSCAVWKGLAFSTHGLKVNARYISYFSAPSVFDSFKAFVAMRYRTLSRPQSLEGARYKVKPSFVQSHAKCLRLAQSSSLTYPSCHLRLCHRGLNTSKLLLKGKKEVNSLTLTSFDFCSYSL